MNYIYQGDCKTILPDIKDESVQLIWTDPPFNTGDIQKIVTTGKFYKDKDEAYAENMRNVFTNLYRVLSNSGVMCVCLDYREVHDIKCIIDSIFGKQYFMGEIVWHFELGNISKSWWTNKHNTILLYSKSDYPLFKFDEVPTTIRKSPKGEYQNPKKVTSVWNFTMSNSDCQRVGYPNQKPIEIIDPFIKVHTNQNDTVLDPFAGSGSSGYAAAKLGRKFILIDENPISIETCKSRLKEYC